MGVMFQSCFAAAAASFCLVHVLRDRKGRSLLETCELPIRVAPAYPRSFGVALPGHTGWYPMTWKNVARSFITIDP